MSTRFELALDAYGGDADWGVLLAGLQVRIYRRSSGISQQYLALDLDTLVELDDEPAWKAFAAMFRAPAFAPGADGVPLIRRVVDESRRHASALAADMRRDVVDAAEAIIQGALDHPENAAVIGEPTRSTLHDLFEESLYVLYRVLFVLYAESTGRAARQWARALRNELLGRPPRRARPPRRSTTGRSLLPRHPDDSLRAPVGRAVRRRTAPGLRACRRRAVRSGADANPRPLHDPRHCVGASAQLHRSRRARQPPTQARPALELRRARRRPARVDLRGPPRPRALPRDRTRLPRHLQGRAARLRRRGHRRVQRPPPPVARRLRARVRRREAQGHRLVLHAPRDHRVPLPCRGRPAARTDPRARRGRSRRRRATAPRSQGVRPSDGLGSIPRPGGARPRTRARADPRDPRRRSRHPRPGAPRQAGGRATLPLRSRPEPACGRPRQGLALARDAGTGTAAELPRRPPPLRRLTGRRQLRDRGRRSSPPPNWRRSLSTPTRASRRISRTRPATEASRSSPG